jgi:hypothetical protein
VAQQHPDSEHARDARHNEAARLEMAREDRARGPAEGIERAAALQRTAEEFRAAFALVLSQPRG